MTIGVRHLELRPPPAPVPTEPGFYWIDVVTAGFEYPESYYSWALPSKTERYLIELELAHLGKPPEEMYIHYFMGSEEGMPWMTTYFLVVRVWKIEEPPQ